MTENQRKETTAVSDVSNQQNNNSVVLRIPKPNLQVLVLGLIAVITVFQTVQLLRISSSASTASTKAVAPATTTNTDSGSSGTGSNADVPQSMVGGC